MSKYDEDLKKACEILNNTELDELVQVAVEAMDDAATDIGMEASQEWHAKITLGSALIHIAEKVAKRPQLTIPKSIADEFDQIYEDMEEYQTNVAQMFSSMQHYFDLESYPEILHWLEEDGKNTHGVLAYLAGKALGVDLVKVVEG